MTRSSAQVVTQVVIGNTTGLGSWAFGPIYRNTGDAGLLNYSRHAYIYTAAELGIPSGSKIIKLEWLKKDGPSITGNNTFDVWISNTSSTSFATSVLWSTLVAGASHEFTSSTYTVTASTNTYIQAPFIDSFLYNGGGLQILTDWAKLGIVNGTVGDNYYIQAASGKAIGLASTTALTGSAALQSSIYGNSRPSIRITYVTVPPCVGTPAPGNTISSAPNVCTGVSFTLTLQNSTIGGLVSYQWQSADNVTFTSGLINLGTGSTLTLTQTANKYYRCVVTCGAGPASATSVPVYVPMSPSYGCFCSSTAQSAADEDIYKFSFGSLQNCSNCSTTAAGQNSIPNLYSNYQFLTPPAVQKGSVVPFSIEVGVCSANYYPNRCAIFIDYNQNTSFADAGELVYSSASATTGAHIESGTITIPTTALTGVTGIRIINSEQGAAITNPCLVYPWGETEDYVINILPAAACSGAPTPGSTIVNLSGNCTPATGTYALCSGKTVDLTLQNFSAGTGITYQWYNNGLAIAGATSPLYTTPALTSAQTYYCNVTCSNSALTTASAVMNITMASFLNCYCSSGAASAADEEILSFTLNGATNVSDCTTLAPGTGSILNQYSNFTPLGNLTNIQIGSTVSFSVNEDDCDVPPAPYYSFATAIWIDFNHNGSMNDAGEQVFVEQTASNGPRTVLGNIIVPCAALPGQTRLRVTIAEGLSGSLLTSCLAYGTGETEDYLINLVQPTAPCTIPIVPGNTESTISIFCDSTIATLSLQNKCLLGNYNYQWFKNSVAITGATSYTYTTPKIFANTTYYCNVSCGSTAVASAPYTIVKSAITSVTLTASSPTYCTGGTAVTLTASSTTVFTYTYNPNSSIIPTSGAIVNASPTATTTYTVTGTNANGCTRTSSVPVTVSSCGTTLNVKLYIQAYYIGSGLMGTALLNQGVGASIIVTDSVTIELRQPTSPYALVATKKVTLSTTGIATATFAGLSGSYYVVVKHRNALETWSAAPVAITSGTYDFTTAANKAYGSNMIQMDPGKWALYTGDLNHDNNVDLLDINILETDVSNFASGYLASDLNGDGNVDLIDTPPAELNTANFIFTMNP